MWQLLSFVSEWQGEAPLQLFLSKGFLQGKIGISRSGKWEESQRRRSQVLPELGFPKTCLRRAPSHLIKKRPFPPWNSVKAAPKWDRKTQMWILMMIGHHPNLTKTPSLLAVPQYYVPIFPTLSSVPWADSCRRHGNCKSSRWNPQKMDYTRSFISELVSSLEYALQKQSLSYNRDV